TATQLGDSGWSRATRSVFPGDRDEALDRHLALESQVDLLDRATAETGTAAKRLDRTDGVGVALAPAQYQRRFRFLRHLAREDQPAAVANRLERRGNHFG